MIDPHNPTAGTRIRSTVDPWGETDDLRAAKGISLAVVLSAVLWLGAFGFLLWAWAS